jgi:hypothetical protein
VTSGLDASAIGVGRADEGYYIGRMAESLARAGQAADSLAKLVHYDLAGRYSVAALAARRRPSPAGCRQVGGD